MKCDLCGKKQENLYDCFDKEICEVCKRQIEEDMDIVELKALFRRRGRAWINIELENL